jgi:NAD(P)-dependent dehydrogenase (short-subunit alcohol dehydrogenase family)
LDILVNNAGVYTAAGPVGDDDPDAWWHDVTVNLRGTYLLCRAALPFMKPGGTIINVGSGAGMKAFPYSSAYGASKAALIHFTETLHLEVESRGLSVFAIRPGAVRTSMMNILNSQKGKQYLGHVAKSFEDDSELLVPAEAPAQMVVRLCGPEAAVLSGRMISVLDDLDMLIERAEQIRAEQLYLLRLHTL